MDTVLVTGANGEFGHALIPYLSKTSKHAIVALDINELDEDLKPLVHEMVVANINDKKIIENILEKHRVTTVFHLAAMLSTSCEKDPETGISDNSDGIESMLEVVNRYSVKVGSNIKFIFPSSIAVYGLPNLETKSKVNNVHEDEFLDPISVYGITKLYGEKLGKYYSLHYQLLNPKAQKYIDFRCIRFPGVISALTIPSGGTSDYGAEMIHTAAQGESYESFVREDTTLPFMVMPDAIKALTQIASADKSKLTRSVYNVNSFSINAKEIADIVLKVFPDTAIDYNPNPERQKIVDSWPAGIDDSVARRDWGWNPDYDVNKAFNEYLIPEIQNKYKK